MKKWTWFLTCFIFVTQLNAQIKTSKVTVEQTSDITTISGQVGIGTLTPGQYNLAANWTTFNSLLDVNGEVLARLGLRVVGPSIGWGQEINFNVFTASLHQNSRNSGSMTGWVAKVHSANDQDPMKLSFFDGYTSVYSAANNAVLDQLDATPVLTLESHNNRVGIGTPNPQEKLHVNGSIRGNASGGAIRIQTDGGYVDVGPQNSGYSHFNTDRSRFYFNKKILVDGAVSTYNQDLVLETAETPRVTILNSNGNVGIGTTVPSYKLDVIGDTGFRGTTYFYGTAYAYEQSTGQYLHFYTSGGKGYVGMNSSNDLILQSNQGKVGIGVTNPLDALHIADGSIRIGTDTGDYGQIYYSAGAMNIWNRWASDAAFVRVGAGNNLNTLTVMGNGRVGIGTTSPAATLHVNGTIKAPATDWSDFVFDEGYELPTLNEVEQHISDHGHLRDIPSEEEVMENDVNLTQMDSRLLQKIEELTLYLIKQNKQIEVLQEKVKQLEGQ